MAQRQQSIQDAVKNYGKRLFSFIRSRVKSDEDAEDILQDVWYKLSSIIDTEPIEQLSSWLYRVSRNRIVDKKRKQTPEFLEDLAYEDEDGEMVFYEALLTNNMNPETEMERAYFREVFFAALKELPEKQREVFVWNELEDLTLQEIADKTNESIKTIISRKHYAVVHLRKRLHEIYNN
ncbi:MAG: sigma-70 family RNA polymerase sigma factor [Bacteroidetes bacterium]|nr:sigma-70 family RNA polymerase sigma factor [Bacteroidota bacterium]